MLCQLNTVTHHKDPKTTTISNTPGRPAARCDQAPYGTRDATAGIWRDGSRSQTAQGEEILDEK